ncbi:MAG: hypothetical protein M1127_02935 [Patescibacteria group bacterium]|nr:hypothetical protein [Patescibacteria group bacterium]
MGVAFIVANVLIFVFLFIGKEYQTAIELIKFLCWPGLIFVIFVVVINSAYLRELFSYLFLSMEEFNFFSIKGKIENVREVIERKIEEGIQKLEKNKQIETLKRGVIELIEQKGESAQESDRLKKIVDSQEKVINKQEELIKLLNEIVKNGNR